MRASDFVLAGAIIFIIYFADDYFKFGIFDKLLGTSKGLVPIIAVGGIAFGAIAGETGWLS